MFCYSCGRKIDDNAKFCPFCGVQSEPDSPAVFGDEASPTNGYPAPTREYGADLSYADDTEQDVRTVLAAQEMSEEDNHTVVIDNYSDTPMFRESFAESMNPRDSYAPEHYTNQPAQPASYQDPYVQTNRQYQGYRDYTNPDVPQVQPVRSYQDSFVQQNQPRFSGNQWQDPNKSSKKQYRKTTAGRRVVSIILCLLMLLFSFQALMIATMRIALSETNVRKAYDNSGDLADMKIDVGNGEQTLTELFKDNVVNSKTNQPIELDSSRVANFLNSDTVNDFTENLAVDFTQFFIFGKTPTLLNSDAIVNYITSIRDEVEEKIGYKMALEADSEYIGKRIDGGDLSFLSIDENGGYFKQKYGFNPHIISVMFSVWMLAVYIGLALVCVILIFIVNRGNLPAGLSFNGTTMIIFGVLNTLIAAGILALSFIKPIFLLSYLLRGIALVMGGISIAVLIVGVILSVVKRILKNRI